MGEAEDTDILGGLYDGNWDCDEAVRRTMNTLLTCTVDMQAQEFIVAYSAFLKRQGKLPIPGTTLRHTL